MKKMMEILKEKIFFYFSNLIRLLFNRNILNEKTENGGLLRSDYIVFKYTPIKDKILTFFKIDYIYTILL